MFNLSRPVTNDPSIPADAQDLTENIPAFDVLFGKQLGGILQGFFPTGRQIRESALSSRFTKSGTWAQNTSGQDWEGGSKAESDNLVAPTVGYLEITLESVTAFRIAFEDGTDRGMFTVTVDGLAPDDATLSLTPETESYDGGEGDTGGGVVDTYSSSASKNRYVGWYGLDGAQHVIRITKTGTRNTGSSGYKVRILGIEHVDQGRCDEVVVLPLVGDPLLVDDASITYVGTWANVDDPKYLRGRAKRSTVDPATNETITIDFTGTGIILYFQGGAGEGNANIQLIDSGALVVRDFDVGFVSDQYSTYRRRVVLSGLANDTYQVVIKRKDELGRWDGSGNNQLTFEGYRPVLLADPDNGYPGAALVAERKVELTAPTAWTYPTPSTAGDQFVVVGMDKNGTLSSLGVAADWQDMPDLSTLFGKCPLFLFLWEAIYTPPEVLQSEGEDPTWINVSNKSRFPAILDHRHYLPILNASRDAGHFDFLASGSSDTIGDVFIPKGAKWLFARVNPSSGSLKFRLRIQEFSSPTFYRYSVAADPAVTDFPLAVPIDGVAEGFYTLEIVYDGTYSNPISIDAVRAGFAPAPVRAMSPP